MTQPFNHNQLTITFPSYPDERGTLTVAGLNRSGILPFKVERVFWITGVPDHAIRGCHAHRRCHEALICLHGSVKVKVDNGCGQSFTTTLSSPDKGLLIPPMVWCELSDFAPGTVCLCLASGDYDKEGYLGSLEKLKAALL